MSNEAQHSPTFDSGFLVMPWHPFHFPCFGVSHSSQFPAFSSRSLPGGRPTCSRVLHGLCDLLVLGFVKCPDVSGARPGSSWVLSATATPTGARGSFHKPGGPCQALPTRGAAGLHVALAPGSSTHMGIGHLWELGSPPGHTPSEAPAPAPNKRLPDGHCCGLNHIP